MHIDIKNIFGYKQHRLKIDKEKKSMMTRKWTPPERESIADSVISCLEQNGYYWLIKEHDFRYSLTAV